MATIVSIGAQLPRSGIPTSIAAFAPQVKTGMVIHVSHVNRVKYGTPIIKVVAVPAILIGTDLSA